MKLILKYFLGTSAPSITVRMPKEHKIIKIARPGYEISTNKLYIWAVVEEGDPNVDVTFLLKATGEILDDIDNIDYIETIFDGVYVRHVYRKKSE